MAGPAAGLAAVQVWLIGTDLPEWALAGLEPLLDDRERERAAALRAPAARRRFVAAHGAVRMIIGERLGLSPARLAWRRGPHGKPELAGPGEGLRVSVSRSGAYAALALARRRVGVDIQEAPAGADVLRVAARFYPPPEAALVAGAGGPADQIARFAQLWARKEACVKVDGGLLAAGLRLSVAGPAPVVVRAPGGALAGSYLVRDVPAPPGFHAAVAVAGAAPCRLERRWWRPAGEAGPAGGAARRRERREEARRPEKR